MEEDGLSKLALLLDPSNLEIEEITMNQNQFLGWKDGLSNNDNEDVYMIQDYGSEKMRHNFLPRH